MSENYLYEDHPWNVLKRMLLETKPKYYPSKKEEPYISWAQKAGIGSKYPLMVSKFKPADIDPNITVYDQSSNKTANREPKIYKSKGSLSYSKPKLPPPTVRTTSIQFALYLLGIDKNVISPVHGKKSFWHRPSEHLWDMLELAKKRYNYEMSHAHPDSGGDPKRASQLNSAWSLVKKLFEKHGYVLHK